MKRSDNIVWSQLKVGIFIVIALVFLGVGIILMGRQTKLFVPKGEVSVLMTDVAGLKLGAPVWLAGIDVGVVTAIHFRDPRKSNDVEIVLQVDQEALKKIGTDSVIAVKTRGLMGEKYVDITPSTHYSDTPPRTLVGTQTMKLDDVVQKAGTSLDILNGVVRKMESGQGSFGKLVNDPKLYDNVSALAKELKEFSARVNNRNGTIALLSQSREPYDKLVSTLNRADDILWEIQHSEGTMSKLIRDRDLYDKLTALAEKSVQAADQVRELNKKLTSPDTTVGRLLSDREMYDKAMNILQRTENSVKAVEEATAKVDRGEGTAGKLINEKELYERTNRMIDNLDELVKDFKANPRKYIKFSIF